MPPSKPAAPPVRTTAAAPLATDTLDGLTGEALREALLARVADALPREGNALRRAAKARGAVGRDRSDGGTLREDLAQAELAATMRRARAGRHLVTRALVADLTGASTRDPDEER